jgi:hypothetical protein
MPCVRKAGLVDLGRPRLAHRDDVLVNESLLEVLRDSHHPGSVEFGLRVLDVCQFYRAAETPRQLRPFIEPLVAEVRGANQHGSPVKISYLALALDVAGIVNVGESLPCVLVK